MAGELVQDWAGSPATRRVQVVTRLGATNRKVMTMKTRNIKAISALALIIGLAATLTLAKDQTPNSTVPRIAPPNSHAFGRTLTEWMGIYWRWTYSGADMAQSVVDGVQLMPLPPGTQTGGAGTPDDPAVYVGQLDITLPPGAPFVLPEYAWIRERYEGWPTVPDDPIMSDEVGVAVGHPNLTIDGRTIITDANKAAFYVTTTAFDPIVVYPAPSSYGSVAAVSFQGVGFVSPPLTPGKHVIHLYEPLIIPAGAYAGVPQGLGVVYDNTWIITVKPGK
jgi:hypothetical protein